MIAGIGVYSFTVGTLSSLLSNLDTRESNLNLKTIYIAQFAKDANIPKALVDKLRKALEYASRNQCFSWAEKQHIFTDLPLCLKAEVAVALHHGVIKDL